MSETFSTVGPICPHCMHRHDASGEPSFYDENMDQMDCDGCGKTFGVVVCHSTSWTCEELP